MKVLVVRFSAIGDCVLAAWPVTAIRRKYPDAEIVWACESRCAPVIDTSTLASGLAQFPRERWKQRRWSPATWREQILYYTGLRKHRFDLGIDFQGHSKTALCLRLAAPARRFAARSTDVFAKWLNPVKFEWDTQRHEVEEYMRFVGMIESFETPTRPIVPDLSEERRAIRSLVDSRSRVVTIQTGAGAEDKRYPLGSWEAVAGALIEQGFTVAAIGAKSDARLETNGVVDWVGKLDLRHALAAVAESAIHLAGDTGTGHVAAASGVPVVSVFGPTPPERFRPYSDNAIVLKQSNSTASVTPDQVLSAVARLVPHHEPAISD